MDRNLPILCSNCGGPVEPEMDLTFICPYCDTEDRLPEDAFKRSMELKKRIAAAARSVAQFTGINAAIAPLFEKRRTFFTVVGTGFGITIISIIGVGLAAYFSGGSESSVIKKGMFLGLSLFVPVGLVLSVSVALMVGRFSYHRRVRPLILARAPREQGKPMRCRACGGDLPDSRDLIIKCDYCSTNSLAARELIDRRLQQLENEEDVYRGRSGALVGDISKIGIKMSRIMIVGVILTYVFMFIALWIFNSLG